MSDHIVEDGSSPMSGIGFDLGRSPSVTSMPNNDLNEDSASPNSQLSDVPQIRHPVDTTRVRFGAPCQDFESLCGMSPDWELPIPLVAKRVPLRAVVESLDTDVLEGTITESTLSRHLSSF
jgi:hypothetical protein